MPILIKPSSITKLFSFSKTMAAASASPVPKLGQQASVKQAPETKRRQVATRTHKNHKSIFSRITSPFKAIQERSRIRNRSKTQIQTICKEIKNNMPDLKENMPSKLQELVKETDKQEISNSYTLNFWLGQKTFTDKNGLTPPKDPSPEVLSEHLTKFCGDDKNQASTLSVLLTPQAVATIHTQLAASSPKLDESVPISTLSVERDVRMMEDNTARIVITQDYVSMGSLNRTNPITVKTTIDVPRENPSPITLNSVDITPASI